MTTRYAGTTCPLLLLTLMLALLLALLTAPAPARGAPLSIDRDGFLVRAGGTVQISGLGVRAVALQPWDGKILIGGDFLASAGAVTRQHLARLNPDGTLDAAFNPAPDGPVAAIALQPDLKLIIVGGSFGSVGGSGRNGLARLRDADGSADGFNPITTGLAVRINALALSADRSNLVIGGSFSELDHTGPCPPNLAGVSAPAAGAGAVNWTYSGTLNGEVQAVLVLDGAVLAGGAFTLPRPHLVRFKPDGTSDGAYLPPVPGGAVRAMALQADGKLVVGGDFTGGGLARSFLARLNRDGSRDGGFDPHPSGYVAALAVQPDGRILVAGGFTGIGATPVPRNHMARINLSGSLDTAFDPNLDAPVLALALQPDGKVLAGGDFAFAGGKPRTRLARCYPRTGALDDDLPDLALTAAGTALLTAVGQHPDGTRTLVGLFTKTYGIDRGRIVRYNEDWSLAARPDWNPRLLVAATPSIIASQPDKSVIIGGSFNFVNYSSPFVANKLHRISARFGPRGEETSYSASLATMTAIGSEGGGNLHSTKAIVPLPPERQPNGEVTEGKIYLGGFFTFAGSPFRYLNKVDSSGVQDPDFLPPDPATTGIVTCISVKPDGTLLVGMFTIVTYNGMLLRLDKNGALLEDLTPSLGGLLNRRVSAIVPLHDGGYLLAGETTPPGQFNDGNFQRNLVRLKSDGTVDETFNVQTRYANMSYDVTIDNVALQSDGGMIIYGIFDTVKDAKGNSYSRDKVARIKADGELDTDFDLGSLGQVTQSPLENLVTVNLQTDGKIIFGGNFLSVGSALVPTSKKTVARMSNGFAWEELSVSADGGTVTWLRGGTGPELWQASFESCDDLESATPACTFLGSAQRVPGGWELAGQNLGALGSGVNRYLRARGNAAGEKGSGGSILESVRLYYLAPQKPVITVTVNPAQGKIYGDPDPPTLDYSFSPALSGTDSFSGSLQRAPGEDAGSYAIGQGTLALSDSYTLVFVGANFTIAPKSVTVRAADAGKQYGDPDPALSATPSGFLPGDVGPGKLGFAASRVSGEDVGSYDITPTAVDHGTGLLANYLCSYQHAAFSITPAPLVITAQNQSRAVGAPNPPLTVLYDRAGITEALLGGVPQVSTTAGPASPPGDYPITVALGSISSTNFSYTLVPGLLTVTGSASQTISLTPPGAKVYGDPDFDPGATASSGLPVSYGSSDTGVATVVGGQIRITGAGSSTITVTQGGNGSYNPCSATFELSVAKAPLTVRAEDRSRAYLAPNPQFAASYQGFVRGENSSVLSGAPLLTTPATPASPVGAYPIEVATGTLAAANYRFVTANGTLNVLRSCQEIVFPPLGERTYGDPPFTVQASACSGLELVLESSDPKVAKLEGRLLTITGAGTATITASQAGSPDLERAPEVSQTLVVQRGWQTISFPPLPERVLGEAPFAPGASASSGLPVSYRSSDPQVAEVVAGSVRLKGAGTAVITAEQAGNGNYHPALPVSQPLRVALEGAPPLISLSTLASGSVTSNPLLNVAGSARDPSGIASLTVNGMELAAQGSPFSCAVSLKPGQNSIEVIARDGAGNRSSETVRIILDPGAPALSLNEPADNSVAGEAGFALGGRAAPGSAVTLRVNGGAPLTLPADGGAFTGSGTLIPGVNTIEVAAALDGRVARVKRSVTLVPGAPALALVEPGQDLRTERVSVTLRGRVGAGAVGVTVEAGGERFAPALAGGGFEQDLTLGRAGEYPVTVTVRDAGGLVTVARRNIIRVALLRGDLDGDGCVDIRDAAQLLRISLGLEPAGAQALAHGDLAPLVDGVPRPDGVIDAGDVLVLLRRIVGLADF